ncbi:MAG: PTS transporter subunit EIIC, partial [Carnobacterium sp.]
IIDWITETIQTPLLALSQGFGAVILIVFLVHLLWFFGIHGTNVMAPVLQTIYGSAMTTNMNAYQRKEMIPYKWVAGSFEAFVWPGGAGVTLMLIVAILIFSKRADSRTVGKLALGPGIFNINEPVMFGMPIVLNPLYMIPFILAPMATASVAYVATMAGLVNPVVVSVIWVMPAGISGFLATGGDWRAIILTLVNLGVALVIWMPFVLAANKVPLED